MEDTRKGAEREAFQEEQSTPALNGLIDELLNMHGMKYWIDTGDNQELWDISDGPYRDEFLEAIAEQNAIGWNNALKGRLSKIWGDISMMHVTDCHDEIPVHISGTWWTGKLIRQILYFSLVTWQHRNEYLHNKDTEDRIRD